MNKRLVFLLVAICLFTFLVVGCSKNETATRAQPADETIPGPQKIAKSQKVLVKSTYEGETDDGEPHGKGTKTWTDGGKYVGDFRDGLMSGNGIRSWADGAEYKGEFKDGRMNGIGTRTWKNGDKYTGQWKNGRMEGKGVMTFADGTKKEGMWVNGKFQEPETAKK